MRTTEKRTINLKVFTIAIAMTICLLIPIWQSSVSLKLEKQIKEENAKLVAINEQKMSMQAMISKTTSPEYLVYQAATRGFQFNQISSITSLNVASNF